MVTETATRRGTTRPGTLVVRRCRTATRPSCTTRISASRRRRREQLCVLPTIFRHAVCPGGRAPAGIGATRAAAFVYFRILCVHVDENLDENGGAMPRLRRRPRPLLGRRSDGFKDVRFLVESHRNTPASFVIDASSCSSVLYDTVYNMFASYSCLRHGPYQSMCHSGAPARCLFLPLDCGSSVIAHRNHYVCLSLTVPRTWTGVAQTVPYCTPGATKARAVCYRITELH
jgi:hypothetical protein